MVVSRIAEGVYYIRVSVKPLPRGKEDTSPMEVGFYSNAASEAEAFDFGDVMSKVLALLHWDEMMAFAMTGNLPNRLSHAG